jgi:hypothetical protein
MTCQGEQLPRPEEFSAFHGVDIPVIKVKTDQGYLIGTELLGSKDRTISISEPAEVVDMREGGALGCGNEGSFESRHPVPEERYIITMRMDNDNRAFCVQLEKPVGRTIKIGEYCVRANAVGIEYIGCRIRGKHHSTDFGKLIV